MAAHAVRRVVALETKCGASLTNRHKMLLDPRPLLGVIALMVAHGAEVSAPLVALCTNGLVLRGDSGMTGSAPRPSQRMRHLNAMTVVAKLLAMAHDTLLPIGLGNLPVRGLPLSRLVRGRLEIHVLDMAHDTFS